MISVENVQHTHFGSDLLRFVYELADADGAEVRLSREDCSGEKDAIITGVVIGVAAHALYDLIRAAAKRLASREDYSALIVLNIDGKPTKLDDILR
jgi:hypothetical protein